MSLFQYSKQQKQLKQGNSQQATSHNPFRMQSNEFESRRVGLQYNPPMIIIEFLVIKSGKLYHKKIKLPNLQARQNNQEMIQQIKKKHSLYIDGKITDEQLEKLIQKLKQRSLQNNVYSDNNQTANNRIGSLIPIQSKQDNKIPSISSQNFWDNSIQNEKNIQNYDLNKLSNEQLIKEKQKMDKFFLKNQKKPGDPGFEYDKQEEFNPKEENEWDLDEDEDIV